MAPRTQTTCGTTCDRDTSIDEVESETELLPLARKSDAVALGSFESETRVIDGDPQVAMDDIEMTCLELTVTDVLSGSLPSAPIPVEFMFGQTDLRDEDLPGSDVVIFLVDKAGVESGRYRAINMAGLWSSTGRAAVDQPLLHEAPASIAIGDDVVLPKGAEWETFVESLRSELADLR